MKSIHAAVLAILAVIQAASAAPRLVSSSELLTPETTIDLILAAPAVETSGLGVPAANNWLVIEPELPGTLTWKSPEIVTFTPSVTPAMGTSYRFSIPAGLSHLDQTEVPAGELLTIRSEPFRLVIADGGSRWSNDYEPSTNEWLLVFNDAVDPQAAGSFLTFSSSGRQRVAATVRPVTRDRAGYRAGIRPWSERLPHTDPPAPDDQPVPDPEEILPHMLLVTPSEPLPAGAEWRLLIQENLPNADASARTRETSSQSIGTIAPFTVASIEAATYLNGPRTIIVRFNHRLPDPLPDDFLATNLGILPEPEGLAATVSGRQLLITAANLQNFDEWQVDLRRPFASAAGLPLTSGISKHIAFVRLDPALSLPSADAGQYAAGSRTYAVQGVNLSEARIRAKTLTGPALVRAYQAYAHYKGVGPNRARIEPPAPLPFALIPGTAIHDEAFTIEAALDTSWAHELKWDDVLPPGTGSAAVFLDVTATSHTGLAERQRLNTQSIVQLTDIGLAWKITEAEAFLHVFSCSTGLPLADATLTLFGEDAEVLGEFATDDRGTALLPRLAGAQHLHAAHGTDEYVVAFDTTLATVGMWHFPVRHSWRKPQAEQRRAFLFTDRTLYRPGETMRLKGIVRTQIQNDILAAKPADARLIVRDPTGNEVFTRPVVLSDNGSFDLSYAFPPGKVGSYRVLLEYPGELARAAETEDWYEADSIRANAMFGLQLQVEEFRRNAFEIEQTLTQENHTTVRAAIAANYYQGQAVADGKVSHFARVSDKNLYPERYRDFLFGNHEGPDWAYWYHYFGYRWDSDHGINHRSIQHQGSLTLTGDGTGGFGITLPDAEFPSAREVWVASEVTDANLQTLTTTSTLTVHPSSVYVGVSRVDRLIRAGDAVGMRLVAITPDGDPLPQDVAVTATLVREVHHAVKTRTPSGGTSVHNDAVEVTVSEHSLDITAAASAGGGLPITLTPQDTGKHLLKVRGTDAEGRAFATVVTLHVYGTKEYPWAYEDGMRVKLVAEKKSYLPGETARVLVLSPIEGTALVTVEREKVLRSFSVPLRAENPVIEIPLEDGDAPNAYVSVLIIKGAQDSAREHREPQLRLGYCELTVHNVRDRLAVELGTAGPDSGPGAAGFRPGEEITVTGTVTLAGNRPAAGAEITLYAEDEGTLAVAGYETPNPLEHFYDPRLLDVRAGTSFHSFIPENPENRSFHNKGFVVGGGDGQAELISFMRKNFDPCATWAPSLIADADGRFSHTFTLPDTLTRYRLIAVVHHGAAKFGHTESSIVVNKPLMIEPKTPRHAHQGDTLDIQTLVQNASEFSGTWEITYQPHAGSGAPVCASRTLVATVTLEPGQSELLRFPTTVETTGEAVMHWAAVPVSLNGRTPGPALIRSHSDAVEARFAVTYPMPLLRQNKFVRFEPGAGRHDLLGQLDRRLLEGDGFLEFELSRSPLAEAGESIDYLLGYPHGCLEQTTSALIPWLAIDSLRHIAPKLASNTPDQTRAVIQAGADRLLSMQRPDGSFSYWPQENQTVDWATSYGALGLILASQRGAAVPESSVRRLCAYLNSALRGLSDVTEAWQLQSHARALWVLSLAGQPQHAYHHLLIDRMSELDLETRSLLALAIADSGAENAAELAKSVLTTKVPLAAGNASWMRWTAREPLRLLALASIAPDSAETAAALDRLLKDRSPYGHWRTTWVNGWAMLAMAKMAETEAASSAPLLVSLHSSLGEETIELRPNSAPEPRSFLLNPDLALSVKSEHTAYARLRVAAKPAILPVEPVSTNGMSIERTYEKVFANGTTEPLDQPAPGDLVRVTLRVTLPNDDARYLVVEDPLPAIFEAINSDFETQRSAQGIRTSENDWSISHSELRDDRAVFYFNRTYHHRTFTINYLARCTLAGSAIAPPAKVEAMYDPEQFALSASRSFTAE